MAKQRRVGEQQRSARECPQAPGHMPPPLLPYRCGQAVGRMSRRMRGCAQPMGAPKLKPPCGTPAAAASGTCCPKRYVPCIARHVKSLLMDNVTIHC